MSRLGAKSILLITGGISIAPALAAWRLLSLCDLQIVLEFFQDHLREPLFVGLLTVAAFLFSLKTFIIVTMKENVYGTASYEKKWKELLAVNSKLKRYQALENFAALLFFSVLVSLVAAVLQFTLGLVDEVYAALFSIGFAVWSIAMIFVSVFHLHVNLRSWFSFLNDNSTSDQN